LVEESALTNWKPVILIADGNHTMKIRQLLWKARSDFNDLKFPTPGLDAEILLAFSIGRERDFLYAHPGRKLSDNELKRFCTLSERRKKGEPVAYITRKKEFWSRDFEVTPDVLIPRPDTEIMVEEVLKLSGKAGKGGIRILEIGTGSGVISITLASELENAVITATDCSPKAIAVAAKNAVNHNIEGKILFLSGDMFTPVEGKFDIIVSNPPYISENEFTLLAPEVRDYEPRHALIAGPEGTEFHCKLARDGKGFLEKNGWLVMEIGAGQRFSVCKILQENDYCDINVRSDYSGIERVVMARKEG